MGWYTTSQKYKLLWVLKGMHCFLHSDLLICSAYPSLSSSVCNMQHDLKVKAYCHTLNFDLFSLINFMLLYYEHQYFGISANKNMFSPQFSND